MLICEEIPFDDSSASNNNDSEELNIGIIKYNNHNFIVQLTFSNLDDSISSDDSLFELLRKQVCVLIGYTHNDIDNISTSSVIKVNPDDIVFMRSLDTVNDVNSLNNINDYVENIIQDRIPDLNKIYEFVSKTSQKIFAIIMSLIFMDM